MRFVNTIIVVLVIIVFSAGLLSADNDADKEEIEILKEKIENIEKYQMDIIEELRAMKERRKPEEEEAPNEVDIDRVIKALTLVVQYQHWREDQRAIQRALERRYRIKRHEDPFAFKSKLLREFLEDVSKEKFERSIEDIEDALKELKDYYK